VTIAALALAARLACQSPAPAAQAPPPGGGLPVSLERIRAMVERPQALDVDVPLSPPVVRFEITVEAHPYMLSFEEQLRKDLELTPLQRQSHDWASRCCGLDLGVLFDPIDRALQRRKERKIREQIARELEALKAAREK
jgi:hypothetical protein